MEQSLVLECQRSELIYVAVRCLDSAQESSGQSDGPELSLRQL